ncbi:DUF397 domain-containing protein [Streptomyces sp. SL13]|uniref:DUF397 domain-containing protein n=1 Tax=Streptantibioticus silvisoli TaxID=2705255 RepID=A0AA90KA19_9ACTN|nr:DUF397 domain-containing protein [Streptantibioticus silvisoli]MDI5971532.1 DUF397 domain-containing protein [Streptantibioticus silvisoli]
MTTTPQWRTSSYTGTENCVEVADGDPSAVMVRDSKDRSGTVLAFPRASRVAFVKFSKRQSV